MKNIKGKVTALIIIIIASILTILAFLFFQFSLQESEGFVHSTDIVDTKSAGLTVGLISIFWLLFIGNYWGFITGELPTEKRLLYQKAVGSLIISIGTALLTYVFIRWGISSNLVMKESLGSLSLALAAFGILCTIVVRLAGIGTQEGKKKEVEFKRTTKIILVTIALALAFALDIAFIYIGKGSLFNAGPAISVTIIAPNIDFILWAIFFILLANVLIEKVPIAAKLKAITITLWIAIIAYFIFWALRFYTPLEPGPASAILSSWLIFGIQFTIDARAHLKE